MEVETILSSESQELQCCWKGEASLLEDFVCTPIFSRYIFVILEGGKELNKGRRRGVWMYVKGGV